MKTRAEQVLFGLTLSTAHGFDDVEGDGSVRFALLLHDNYSYTSIFKNITVNLNKFKKIDV